ncbi:hypothetical protein [Luteibacter sp. 3190]|uniref:hypothetical protein n=1 Tax=Luteibacter sp. 3190 TaxID=2817736 RepID=UPI00285545F9|nr:hypothetical protein [Luteibacter sp. 3190]MDR6935351.1 hypothetical protein [Luteibacter sp. 3190]
MPEPIRHQPFDHPAFASLRPSLRLIAALAFFGWCMSSSAVAASAVQADVCYSPAASSDAPNKLTASTTLDCPQAGQSTLPQLAQAGWAIASVQPVVMDYGADPATHTPRSTTSWMVIIQKGAK